MSKLFCPRATGRSAPHQSFTRSYSIWRPGSKRPCRAAPRACWLEDQSPRQPASLFNYLVSAGEQRRRHLNAERLRSRCCRGARTARADIFRPSTGAARCRATPTMARRSESPALKRATIIGRAPARCTRVVHHRNGRTNPNSTSSSSPYVFLASRAGSEIP
jgi:hypothetical protein